MSDWIEHDGKRKPWKDGWYKQHHPETVAARRKARHDKWDAEMDAYRKARVISNAERAVIEAAKAWHFARKRGELEDALIITVAHLITVARLLEAER